MMSQYANTAEAGGMEGRLNRLYEQLEDAKVNGDVLDAHNLRHQIDELQTDMENRAKIQDARSEPGWF